MTWRATAISELACHELRRPQNELEAHVIRSWLHDLHNCAAVPASLCALGAHAVDVAERVGWIENQSASLEEALEELSLVLEERDVLEPLQRVTSFRKRATSFRKAGPESQAL